MSEPVDTVVEELRARLLSRSERGIAKYGTTLDRGDLSLADWLDHLTDELLDAALYARRIRREVAR